MVKLAAAGRPMGAAVGHAASVATVTFNTSHSRARVRHTTNMYIPTLLLCTIVLLRGEPLHGRAGSISIRSNVSVYSCRIRKNKAVVPLAVQTLLGMLPRPPMTGQATHKIFSKRCFATLKVDLIATA